MIKSLQSLVEFQITLFGQNTTDESATIRNCAQIVRNYSQKIYERVQFAVFNSQMYAKYGFHLYYVTVNWNSYNIWKLWIKIFSKRSVR